MCLPRGNHRDVITMMPEKSGEFREATPPSGTNATHWDLHLKRDVRVGHRPVRAHQREQDTAALAQPPKRDSQLCTSFGSHQTLEGCVLIVDVERAEQR
jgi:hypothetical protein